MHANVSESQKKRMGESGTSHGSDVGFVGGKYGAENCGASRKLSLQEAC